MAALTQPRAVPNSQFSDSSKTKSALESGTGALIGRKPVDLVWRYLHSAIYTVASPLTYHHTIRQMTT